MVDHQNEPGKTLTVKSWSVVTCLAVALTWLGPAAAVAKELAVLSGDESPTETVKRYFDAIASGDCERAARLRPGYAAARCRSITGLTVGQVRLDSGSAESARVFISVSYSRDGRTVADVGTFTLTRRGDGWVIDRFSKLGPSGSSPQTEVAVPARSPVFDVPPQPIPVPPTVTSEPPVVEAPPPPPPAATSLLTALWNPAQLLVRDGDRTIKRLRPADHSPPDAEGPVPEPAGPLPAAWRNSIRRVVPADDRKLVALTFDLCERADDVTGYDGSIVDLLRREGVAATFFAGGKWLRSHPERAMQLMADPLFEVGNHGWTHGNLRVLPLDQAREQVAWTQAQYALLREELVRRANAAGIDASMVNQVPPVPAVFRFPYGTCRPETLQLVNDMGLAAIQWDVVSADAVKGQSATVVRQTVVGQVKPGSIVVMHGNGRGSGTAEALPSIVTELRRRGFQFVTVSDLLRSGKPQAADDCYELKPGDNKRYDALFGGGTG
jgi:Predicted xylanase/chitin deacetylase